MPTTIPNRPAPSPKAKRYFSATRTAVIQIWKTVKQKLLAGAGVLRAVTLSLMVLTPVMESEPVMATATPSSAIHRATQSDLLGIAQPSLSVRAEDMRVIYGKPKPGQQKSLDQLKSDLSRDIGKTDLDKEEIVGEVLVKITKQSASMLEKSDEDIQIATNKLLRDAIYEERKKKNKRSAVSKKALATKSIPAKKNSSITLMSDYLAGKKFTKEMKDAITPYQYELLELRRKFTVAQIAEIKDKSCDTIRKSINNAKRRLETMHLNKVAA